MNTFDTTRIYGEDPFTLAVQASRVGFPSRDVPWRPKAVILCPVHDYRYAFCAAALIHHPIGAPILFVDHTMPELIQQEIIRLAPTGENSPTQVFLIGPISSHIENQVRRMGMSTLRIGNDDPAYTAYAVAHLRVEIANRNNTKLNSYFIISGEHFMDGIGVPGYSAHSGTPILFVAENQVPKYTENWIKEHPEWNAYVVGSHQIISNHVVNEIQGMSSEEVTRIEGVNPFETSVKFSAFYDSDQRFGWNRNKKGRGDAFSFVPVRQWHNAAVATLFSHMGKHAPILSIEPNHVPASVANYLLALNPEMTEPPMPPFMHGFVIGDYRDVSFPTQVELEKLLILMAGDMHETMM